MNTQKIFNPLEFEEEYFVGGSVSNYQNYLAKKYDQLCEALIEELELQKGDVILDYGCGTGALLKEFKKRGFKNLSGTDISRFSIDFGKDYYDLKKELCYYNLNLFDKDNDWMFFLDVLEHLPDSELKRVMELVGKYKPKKGLLIRIPVSYVEGENYALEVSRNDKTHIQCHTAKWWISLFESYGFIFDKHIQQEGIIWNTPGVLVATFK